MYKEFYKLSAKPFQMTPDHHFYYDSSAHHKAFSYLQYGMQQDEGFIVVVGDIGSGKTLLIQKLIAGINDEHYVIAQLASTNLNPVELLQFIAASFGLQYSGHSKAELLHNLQLFFTKCILEGKRIILIVDEAQNLPADALEELRMLSNFQNKGRALLQTFLLGQNNFLETIQLPQFEQLRQRIVVSCQLTALNRTEMAAYIEHRLTHSGWSGNLIFTERAYDKIFTFTDGIPRRINVLCDRLLLQGALEQQHEIDDNTVILIAGERNEEVGSRKPKSNTQESSRKKKKKKR